MYPGRGAAKQVRIAFPRVVADLARARRAPEEPHQLAVACAQRKSGAAVAVVRAAVEHAVAVDHRDLLHVTPAVVLFLPDDCARVLAELDHGVAAGDREDLAFADRHAAARQAAAVLRVLPLR